MARKNVLTAFHCLMAAIVTPAGMTLAGMAAERSPVTGLVGMIGAAVLPVLIATRIAWTAGYSAGRIAK